MKTCARCGIKKPLEQFTKDRQKRDGLRSYCKACKGAADAIWRKDNKAVRSRYWKEYRAKNAEQVTEWNRQWAAKNRDKVRARGQRFVELNPHIFREKAAKRRAAKRQATPDWANQVAIRQYYVLAAFLSAELGVPFEVDHIVPIRSEIVCGLHTHTNLNITLAAWNNKKGNRHWPMMP